MQKPEAGQGGERKFPILQASRIAGFPASIPWSFLAPHERQAVRNHGQTLEQLASRGGLDWLEIEWIIQGRGWDYKENPSPALCRAAAVRLRALLKGGFRVVSVDGSAVTLEESDIEEHILT